MLPVPDSWQVMTNGNTTALRSLQLRMPNSRYTSAQWLICVVYLYLMLKITTPVTINTVNTYASPFSLFVYPVALVSLKRHCSWP